ncbi:Glycerate dehydrogenase [Anaerohalosphaera lusitana]|uniref:Glycerate dehydrogenase n=1 Tax=Anaerohalosphaera lusitana TaxID=1936003 RepID=A0A1U9NLC1_9BACT|nr:D-2-hydroxyacid dehydrogenase [Anaerohalosphaera lusitana]AQT68306.1 Glycerate dehydrogenase [Anaerohalosphaera lusitana]
MNIVLLDSHTVNPGDLSCEPLEKLGTFKLYDRTKPEQVIERSKEAEILLTNKTIIRGEHIAALPKLKYIGVLATGYNTVDIDAARKHNITVTNVPAYSTDSVAQTVFAHLLAHTQHVADHSREVSKGRWCESEDFCYWDFPLIELAGNTMGILGLGQIGKAVAQIAQAFGMNVIAHSRSEPDDKPAGVQMVGLKDLFTKSDVLSVNCPLTEQTQGLVNHDLIARMKPNAIFINTSRGPIVEEQALADALNNERIAGAGLDVLSTEPPNPDNPLLNAKNCTITPHIGWATLASRKRCLDIVAENIKAFMAGDPQNVVS